MSRTDCHCPKNFQVEDYSFEFCFTTIFDHDGFPVDEDGLGSLLDLADSEDSVMADVAGVNVPRCRKFHETARDLWLRCDVCGARFKNGTCLRHEPTGEYILVGWECSNSIGDARRAAKGIKRATLLAQKRAKKAREVAQRAEAAQKILTDNPELRDALELDHYIIRDIKARLNQWGNISEKQIALVLKIRDQIKSREVEEENWIPAPVDEGRREVTATLLAVKWTPGFGWNATEIAKGFFKVHTPEGDYKAWGTIPEAAWDHGENQDSIKGRKMTFVARFTVAKDDPTMTFFKRPTFVRWED